MDEKKPGDKPKTAKSSANVFQRIGSAIKKTKEGREAKEPKSIFRSKKENAKPDAGAIDMQQEKSQPTKTSQQTSVVPPVVAKPIPPVSPKVDNAAQEHAQPQPQQPTPSAKVQPVSPGKRNRGLPQQLAAKPTYDPKALKKNTRAAPVSPVPPEVVKPVPVEPVQMAAQKQDGAKTLNVALIGDKGVGKTSIAARFAKDSPYRDVDGKKVELKVFDKPQSYEGMNGIVVVFDFQNKESFREAKRLIREVQENTPKEVDIILVGNKAGEEGSVVDYGEARGFAANHGIPFFANSVNVPYTTKEGRDTEYGNVSRLFDTAARRSVFFTEHPEERPERVLVKVPAKEETVEENKTSEVQLGPKPVTQSKATVVKEEPKKLSAEATKELVDKLIKEAAALLSPSPERIISAQDQLKPLSELIVKMEQQLLAELSDEQKQPLQENLEKLKAIMPEKIKAAFLEIKADKDKKFEKLMSGQVALSVMLNAKKDITRIIGYCGQYLTSEEDSHIKQELEALIKHLDDPINKKLADTIEKFKSVSQITDIAPDKLSSDLNDIEIVMLEGEQKEQLQQGLLLKLQDRYAKLEELLQGKASSEILAAKNKFYQDARSFLPDGNPLKQRIEDELFELINNPLKALESKEISLESFYELNVFEAQQKKQNLSLTEGQLARLKTIKKAITVKIDEAFKKTLAAPSIEILATSHLDIFRLTQSSSDVEKLIASLKSIPNPAEQLIVELDKISQSRALSPAQKAFALDRLMGNFQRIYGDVNKHALAKYNEISENLTQAIAENIYNAHQSAYNQCDFSKLWTAKEPSDAFTPVSNLTGKITLKMRDNFAEATSFESRILLTRRWLNVVGTLLAKHNLDLAYQIFAQLKVDAAPYLEKIAKEKGPDANLYQALLVVMDDFGNKANLKAVGEFFQNNNQSYLPTVAFVSNSVLTRKEGLAQSNPKEREELSKLLKQTIDGMAAELNSQKTQAVGEVELDQHFESSVTEEAINKKLDLLRGQKEKVEEGAKRKGLAVTDSKSTERLSSIQLLGLVGKTVGYAVAVDKTFQQAALKAKLRQIQKSDISESEKVLIAKLYEAVIEFRENIKGAIDEKWLGAEGEIAKIFREMDKVEPKSEAFKDALAFARESVKRRLEHLEKPLGEIRVALAQEDEFGVNPISALGTEPEFDRKEIGKLKSIFASKEARVFKEINELLDALSTFREQSNPSPKGAVVTALKKVEPSDVEGSMGKALNTAKQILQGLETQKIGKALESVEAKTYNILKSAISYAEKNIDARLSDPRLEGKGYSTSVTQVLSKVTAELPLDIVPAAAVVAEPKKDDKEKAEETGPLQRIPGSGKEVINELILLFNNLNKDGNHKELADLIPELGQLLDAERKNNTALVESNIGVVNNIIQKVPLDVPPLVVTPVLSRKPLAINEDQHASMLNTGYQYYEEDCAALTARFLEQKGAEVGSGLLPEIFVGADGTPMHVFVLEMTGASHNLVGAGRNLSYIFNKNTRSPDDVFLNLLDKIKNLNDLHDYDEVIRAHYGDQLEQEHAVLMTEAVSNKLKECHWDNAELKVFLDEREQERVGHDPIEDMAPYLAGQEKVTCRALFPFNLGGGHWILGEVDFIKNGKDITVKFNPHDPLGGGHFSDAEITEEFKSGIEGRLIQALGRDIKAKFENASNNEPARQVERVKVACGAFTMNDLFLRAENKPVGLPIADTTDLRKWQYGILRGKPAVAFTLAPVAAPVALAAVPKVHAPSPTEKPATQLSDEQLLAKIKTPEGLAEIYDRENNAIEFDGKKTRAHEASQRLSRLIPDTKAFAELNGRLLLLEAQKQITGTDNKFLRTGSLARECLERMMERTSPDFAEQLVNSYKAAEAKSPQPKVEQPAVEVKPEPKKSGLLNTLRGFLNRVASKPSSDVVSGPVMQQQPRTTNELKLTPEAFEEFLVNVLNVVPPEMKSVFQQLFVKGSSDKVTADGEAEQLMFFLKSLANKYLLSEAYGTDPREGAKLSERMKDNMAAGEKGNPNYKALLRELVYPVVKEDINTPEGLARILTASRQGNADVVLAKIYFPEGKTEEDNAALVALAKRLMQLEFADDPKNMLRRKSLAAECLREVLRRSDFVNQVYAHYQTFMKDKDSDKFQKAFFAAIPAAAKEIMGINCLPSEMSDETKKLRAQDLMFFASSFASRSLLNGKDFDPLTSLNFVAYAQNDMTPDNKEYADFLIGTVYSGIANDKAERNTAVLKVVDTLRDISPPLEEPQPKPEPTVSAKMDVEQVDVKVEKPVAPKPVIAKPETPKVESGPIPEGNKQRVEIAFDAMMLPLGDEKTDKKIYEIKSLLRQGTVDKAELEKELDELLVGLMAALAEEDKKPITVEKPKGLRNVVLARLTEPEAPMKTSAKYDSINGVIFHVKEAMKEIGVPEKEVMTLEVLKARLQEPEPKSDMHKRVLDFVGRHPKDETVVGFAKNYEAAVLGKDRSLYMMYASFLDAAYKKYGTDELFNSRELFNPVLSRAMDCADRLQGMLRDKKVDVAVAKNFLEQNLKVLLPLVKEKFPEQHKELVGEIREAASKLKDSKNADLAKLCNDILADKLFAVEPVVSQSKTPPSVEPPRTQEPEPKSDMHKKVLDFVGRHPKDEGVKGFAKNYEVAVLGKDPKSYMMYASFLDAVYKKYGTDELFNSRELFNPVLSRAMDCADRFQGMLRNKKVDVAEVKNFLEQNLKVLLPLVEAKFPEQHKEIVGEIREAASKFKDSKNTELAKFCNDILKDKLFTVEPAAPRVAQKPAQFVAIDAVEMNLPEAKPQIAEAVKITPAAAPQAGATTFNFCRKENWDNYWKAYAQEVHGKDESDPAVRLAAHKAVCAKPEIGIAWNEYGKIIEGIDRQQKVFNKDFYDYYKAQGFGPEKYRRNYIIDFRSEFDSAFLAREKDLKKIDTELELRLNSAQFVSDFANPTMMKIMQEFCTANKGRAVLIHLRELVNVAQEIQALDVNLSPLQKAERIADILGKPNAKYPAALAQFRVQWAELYEKLDEKAKVALSEKLEAAGFLKIGEDADKFLMIAAQWLPRYPLMLRDIGKETVGDEQKASVAQLAKRFDSVAAQFNRQVGLERDVRELASIRGGQGKSNSVPSWVLDEQYRSIKERLLSRASLDNVEKKQLIKDMDDLVSGYAVKLGGSSKDDVFKQVLENISNLLPFYEEIDPQHYEKAVMDNLVPALIAFAKQHKNLKPECDKLLGELGVEEKRVSALSAEVHEDDDELSSEVVIQEPWEEVGKPVQTKVDEEEYAVHVSSDEDEGDDEEESGESGDEFFSAPNPYFQQTGQPQDVPQVVARSRVAKAPDGDDSSSDSSDTDSEDARPQGRGLPDAPPSPRVVAPPPKVAAPKVAARAPAIPLKGIDAFMGEQGPVGEQNGRRVEPDMTLNELLNFDTSVSVISEIKNPQARAMILRDIPQLAAGYNTRQDYFAKAPGTVYLRSENREQNVINVAESLAKHSPEIKFFQNLLGKLNNIEEQQAYQTLMFLAKDTHEPVKDMGYFQSAYIAIDDVMGILQGNEVLKGNVKGLLALKGRFEAVERLAIEKQGSDDYLPAVEKALHAIDISPLQKVRDYIAENLGQRTIQDLYNETHYAPAMPNKNIGRKEWLAHVLDAAKQQFGFEAGVTSSGPREMVVDGIKVEVRYFAKGEMNLVNFDHVKERVNFLAEVADTGLMKAAHEEELSPAVFKERQAKIQSIKENYGKYAEEKFKNIENVSGERFEELTEDAHRMFLEMEKELVAEVYPDVKLAKAIKHFEKESQEVLIAKGRLPVVHVMGDGMISAQIPKPPEGKKNYPSTYRDSDKAGVNPNSVIEIVARRKAGGEVEIQSEISRAVSYSVLGISSKKESEIRKSLSYQNARADLIDLLQLREGELEDGGTLKLHSTSLLTPAFIEKVGSKLVKLIGRFPSESRQLRDHHRALEMLNGQWITFTGKDGKQKTVQVEISHTNFSVKPSDKLKGKENKTLRALINNRGWGKYGENQFNALMNNVYNKEPEKAAMQTWLRTYCCPEPTATIKNLEKELQGKYHELAGILDKANPEEIDVKQSKACQKEIKKLERELSSEYEALYKPIREKWTNNVGLPSRLKIDKLTNQFNAAKPGIIKNQLKAALEREEKKYEVRYQDHVKNRIPGPPMGREFPKDKQLFYFLEAQNLYYSGAYQHRPSYLFAAAMARSNELGGIACLANCKSANDRTKWLMDCVKLLLKYENEHNDHPMMLDLQANMRPEDRKGFFFEKMLPYLNDHLQEIHRQAADMRGLEYNRPGAPGSVVDDPFYGDPEGRDKPISKWGKVKPTKRDVFMAWLKPKAERNPIAEKILDAMLAMRLDDPNVANAQKLKDVENRVLALAMVNVLANKNIRIPGDEITDTVIRINNLTKGAIMPDQFPAKYQDFLNIVKDIPGINDMRGEFIVAVVMKNRQLDLKDFKGQMKEDSLAVLSPEGRVKLIGDINRELDIARKHILHLNAAKQYFEANYPDEMKPEIKALSAELKRMNEFVVSLDKKVEKLMENLKALPQEALDKLHAEMTREFNTVTTEIAHYDTKKPDLLNDPEKLAERARMEGFRLDSSRNLVAVQSERQNREQRHAKKVTEAEKRVHFVELEVETTALSVRDPNPEHKNKAHHAFVFQDNHFHPINDPSKDVRYGSDQHHIIDVKDNVVSYRVPQHEDAVSLTDKQKEVLVDKMLDIALEHSENPREDADKFEFSGTFTQMAQDRLSAAIERRMAEVEAKGPAPAPGLESGPSIHE